MTNNKKENNHSQFSVTKLQEELLTLKIISSKGSLSKSHQISQKRKEIARILTEKNRLKKQSGL